MSAHDCAHGVLLPLDAALACYAREVRSLPAQRLPVADALQHVLAAPVSAAVDLPMFTQSAVDGYALRSADLATAGKPAPLRLPLAGEVRAGVAPDAPLPAGHAMRIFTGGRLPAGADTVARQEIVERDGEYALLRHALAAGVDVRMRGEELRAGSPLAQAGQRLHAGLIAALAMAGVAEVEVARMPRVRVLVTGDEVTQGTPGEAGVFDANGPLLRSWFLERGYPAPQIDYVIDDRARLRDAVDDALRNCDLLLTTGGVSVGDHDLVRPVAAELGVREVFWQVAQKPGKPLYFGVRDHDEARPLMLGLPGNPGAVLIGLHVHVAAVLAHLQNAAEAAPAWRTGRLAAAVRADAREQLLRMSVRIDGDGRIWLERLDRQDSHMLSNLASAGALVRIPAAAALDAHAVVQWLALP
ncbi:molybdopterin molybdotransferase MoeA [Solimonas terrae]|uniref:Molybdopterin molybdenumtransferase n=1 Tax=Solimonas terrae TaxID=1396819 RepID=A0A6M2BML4_9GAMM|nr:molybdopterin molybdotransferase MoeA [Solimonas terrae]NGY03395.1 molybdopterin molybdotransferase MoeA [Solimonas terrae]